MVRNNLETEEIYTLELRPNSNGYWECEGKKYRPYFSKPLPSLSDRAKMAAEGVEYLAKHVKTYGKHPQSFTVNLCADKMRIIIID